LALCLIFINIMLLLTYVIGRLLLIVAGYLIVVLADPPPYTDDMVVGHGSGFSYMVSMPYGKPRID